MEGPSSQGRPRVLRSDVPCYFHSGIELEHDREKVAQLSKGLCGLLAKESGQPIRARRQIVDGESGNRAKRKENPSDRRERQDDLGHREGTWFHQGVPRYLREARGKIA